MTLERRTPLKRSCRLRRVSSKGAQRERDLDKARAVLVERSGGVCELRCSSYCTGVGTGSHHLLKRSQGGDHRIENLRWSCDPCNAWVEDNPADAHALGLVVKSWEAS